ncbi:MAG: hypothetical protein MZV64_16940 [Ignavibacteriales bacterium]|nr:hypothetical protein [Ignavibacteriales bacterium]
MAPRTLVERLGKSRSGRRMRPRAWSSARRLPAWTGDPVPSTVGTRCRVAPVHGARPHDAPEHARLALRAVQEAAGARGRRPGRPSPRARPSWR